MSGFEKVFVEIPQVEKQKGIESISIEKLDMKINFEKNAVVAFHGKIW